MQMLRLYSGKCGLYEKPAAKIPKKKKVVKKKKKVAKEVKKFPPLLDINVLKSEESLIKPRGSMPFPFCDQQSSIVV